MGGISKKHLLDNTTKIPIIDRVGGRSTPDFCTRTEKPQRLIRRLVRCIRSITSAMQITSAPPLNDPPGRTRQQESSRPSTDAIATQRSGARGQRPAVESVAPTPNKRPQQAPLVPQLDNRNTISTMTQRFEARYEEQVEKGRNVDIRV